MRIRTFVGALFTVTLAWLTPPAAQAATLQPVSNWGASGVPSDVTMHIYVPDRVATNPPVLVLVHYCGGTAAAVFGQAQGIAKAADQYGFIMVVPESRRCWDVVSNKTRMRDGGGDSHAIRQMVTYALDAHDGNSARVYATGNSSGGMMTQLLLALYPDVFKAGAAFAGMPAGCRGDNESGSGGGYSGNCAGGKVMHTAEEWGDIARMMYPSYTGHRPRVQLVHGDADDIILYPNHTEAIKQWTNVLGLSTNPTTTDASVPLGTHQATRLRWQNECGYVVLDAFASKGGDHGPSDALFPANHVVPFLGLDKTGPVDPEIAQCDSGGGGTGGMGTGGKAGNGGAGPAAGAGASQGGTGTAGSAGGSIAGAAGLAGTPAGGGANAGGSGGAANASGGAASPSGGAAGPSGGVANPSGGAPGAGASSAGTTASSSGGPATAAGSMGAGAASGPVAPTDGEAPETGGCRFSREMSTSRSIAVFALGLALTTVARRRRRRS